MRQKTFGGANGRIPQICARLDKCSVFADIGCDHGYCTRYMLDNGLCDRAIVTDISQKSLNKAAKLLNEEVRKGKVECVCCDGLDKVRGADLVLIAGMGGESRHIKARLHPRTLCLSADEKCRTSAQVPRRKRVPYN